MLRRQIERQANLTVTSKSVNINQISLQGFQSVDLLTYLPHFSPMLLNELFSPEAPAKLLS